MTFQAGVSGNAKGRPPRSRALTEILERAGNQAIEVDGERITGKRLLARLAWEAALRGRVSLPDDTPLVLSVQDWIALVKWLYSQVDGPPPATVKLDVEMRVREAARAAGLDEDAAVTEVMRIVGARV